MKKRETGLSQKKKAVGLHTAFSFYSCFQDISIKYGMIVFQNLVISFSSIEYGCSCTCSCQEQDPCPKHWIPICLKVMILARFSTKTAYINSKNRNAFCKNIEILSFYRKCELCLFRITSYRVQVKPPDAYKFIRSMSIHSLCIKLDSCPHLLLHFSLIFCFCL